MSYPFLSSYLIEKISLSNTPLLFLTDKKSLICKFLRENYLTDECYKNSLKKLNITVNYQLILTTSHLFS